jgi:nucleoside-diphosphate-sugar epimerase
MKILVTGAVGQIGSELTLELRKRYGAKNVIATMHRTLPSDELKNSGIIEKVDATDKEALRKIIKKYNIDTIYHLVGILSAIGEKKPDLAWHINMTSLKNVLDIAIEHNIKKVFWPSSIAAFGPTTPRVKTPQRTVLEPTTMYGVTKIAGELLCQYYFEKYNLDVRSLRYPGVISWKTPPGGGTTDYAVAIFYEALEKKSYEFFVRKDTILPMMYMDDAVKATCDLMEAPAKNISVRTSYNLTALSFSAEELAKEVQKHIPDLKVTYKPDFRQKIADSWPQSIDDSQARKDWGWKPDFTLSKMSKDMLNNLCAECNRF